MEKKIQVIDLTGWSMSPSTFFHPSPRFGRSAGIFISSHDMLLYKIK